MANKDLMDTTSNNSIYNRTRKIYLEDKGEIHCSWCPYHEVENFDKKCYGVIFINTNKSRIRYPSWKLVSKNRKQWMKKPIRVKRKQSKYFEDYFELFF